MPKVSVPTLVGFCDFCPDTGPSSRSHTNCTLCGALLCFRHEVRLLFYSLTPTDTPSDRDARVTGSFSLRYWERYYNVCPTCSEESLAGVIRRLKAMTTEENQRDRDFRRP
jgi:ribosomal protein L32